MSSDDIVERLRDAWRKAPPGHLALQAADEIERQRNLLGHFSVVLAEKDTEVERLRADMDQITGFLAGVGTVHTEDGALAGINNLSSVQAAWERGLSTNEQQ